MCLCGGTLSTLQHAYAAVILAIVQQSAALVWNNATKAGLVQLLTRSSYWSRPSHHRHYTIGGSTIYERKRMAPFFRNHHPQTSWRPQFSRRQYSTLKPECSHERGL